MLATQVWWISGFLTCSISILTEDGDPFCLFLDYMVPRCAAGDAYAVSPHGKVLLRMPRTIVSSSMKSLCIWNRIWCWFVPAVARANTPVDLILTLFSSAEGAACTSDHVLQQWGVLHVRQWTSYSVWTCLKYFNISWNMMDYKHFNAWKTKVVNRIQISGKWGASASGMH